MHFSRTLYGHLKCSSFWSGQQTAVSPLVSLRPWQASQAAQTAQIACGMWASFVDIKAKIFQSIMSYADFGYGAAAKKFPLCILSCAASLIIGFKARAINWQCAVCRFQQQRLHATAREYPSAIKHSPSKSKGGHRPEKTGKYPLGLARSKGSH